MPTWKRLKSVTQSFSHHLQSGLSCIQPYVSDELKRIDKKIIEIELLPEIVTEKDFQISEYLMNALGSAIDKLYTLLDKEGFNNTEIVNLKVIIEQQDYSSWNSAITTIAITKDGREITGFVQYIGAT